MCTWNASRFAGNITLHVSLCVMSPVYIVRLRTRSAQYDGGFKARFPAIIMTAIREVPKRHLRVTLTTMFCISEANTNSSKRVRLIPTYPATSHSGSLRIFERGFPTIVTKEILFHRLELGSSQTLTRITLGVQSGSSTVASWCN